MIAPYNILTLNTYVLNSIKKSIPPDWLNKKEEIEFTTV